MSTTESEQVVEKTELDEFQERVAKERERYNIIASWHIEAHVEAGVILPYGGDNQFVSLTKQNWDGEEGKWIVDVDETLDRLRKVAKFAHRKGCKIEKRYDSDFELDVTIHEEPTIMIHYSADRGSVCEKKVVGTKVIPARVVPERVEEIVEWDCQKVSLLADKA